MCCKRLRLARVRDLLKALARQGPNPSEYSAPGSDALLALTGAVGYVAGLLHEHFSGCEDSWIVHAHMFFCFVWFHFASAHSEQAPEHMPEQVFYDKVFFF